MTNHDDRHNMIVIINRLVGLIRDVMMHRIYDASYGDSRLMLMDGRRRRDDNYWPTTIDFLRAEALLCALYGESYIFGGRIIQKSMQIDWKYRRHVSHLRTNLGGHRLSYNPISSSIWYLLLVVVVVVDDHSNNTTGQNIVDEDAVMRWVDDTTNYVLLVL